MCTSRPHSSVPRTSKRAGSASVVPAAISASACRICTMRSTAANWRAVVDAAHVALVGGHVGDDRRPVRDRRARRCRSGSTRFCALSGLSAATQRRSSAVGAAMTPVLISSSARCAGSASFSSTIARTAPAPSRTMRPKPDGSGTRAVSTASLPPLRLPHQRGQRRGRHQRNVADRHQRHAVRGKRIERHARRIAGAVGRVLRHEADVGGGNRRPHGIAAETDDDGDRARRKRAHGGQDMGDERPAGQRVQDFRQRRMHALALPGGEDRDVERGGHRRERDDTPPDAHGPPRPWHPRRRRRRPGPEDAAAPPR